MAENFSTDIRFEVSKRFYEAIERIINDHKAENYRDVERQTGIEHQRINSIKSYVTRDKSPAYVPADYIYKLDEIFGVNARWVITGKGDFYLNSYSNNIEEVTLANDGSETLMKNPGKITLLERVDLLEKKFNQLKSSIGF